MKDSIELKRLFIAVILVMAGINETGAQTAGNFKTGRDLFIEIKNLDSIVFRAFNERDTASFKKFFSKDLEFYHDKGGLTGYEHTIGFMRSTAQSKSDLKRTLIEEGLEIFPVPGYGAMQIGKHRFCHTENNKQECADFKFVHIWQLKDDGWKITRVISYDH